MKKKCVAIIDAQFGNLASVINTIKYLGYEYDVLKNGNPIIKNCVSNLDCKIEDKIKKGDHIIFICKVSQVLNNNKLKPLIYFNSKYFD